ncbi:MAG: AAA family ATPase [Polyangiaceae bacterium]|nr:AAA family ATPase [Polyangiaceae bacterium]
MTDSKELELSDYDPDARALVAAAQSLADEQRHREVTPLHLLVVSLREPGVAEVCRRSGADPERATQLADAALGRVARAKDVEAYLSASLLELLRRAEREAKRERAPRVSVEALIVALSQEIRGEAGEVLGALGVGPGAFRPHLAAYRETPPRAAAVGAAGAVAEARGLTRDLLKSTRDLDPVIGRSAELRALVRILGRRGKHHPLLSGEPGVGKSAIVRGLALAIAGADVPAGLASARLLELDAAALTSGPKLRGEVEARARGLLASIDRERGETLLVVEGLPELVLAQGTGASALDAVRALLDDGRVRVIATATPDGLRRLAERESGLVRRFSEVQIDPPSLELATEILRGVAPRFERHHGVAVGEDAVRAAVRLSARYLGDRALPDSAVDLLDETAAELRVSIDGLPEELDARVRRLASLRLQRAALDDDATTAARAARSALDEEIAALAPAVSTAQRELEVRRGARLAVASIERELSREEAALAQAKLASSARAHELEFVTLPDVRRRLALAVDAASHAGPALSRAVTEEDVAAMLERWTGIPVSRMLEGETAKLLGMEARLSSRVVGQLEAISALSRAVRRSRVGLRDAGRPIGSFLFLGPSGVGKTELAKALAELLFDDETALTRLDMSEFMERHMAQRLLGAPPGYADSEQGGFLTEAVRRRPYSVLLFDEVEKAHADVFNLLLQVLDDGRLTDGRGRVADFSNTVVILTSNIGSARILDADTKLFESEDGRAALKDVLFDELKAHFRPEFLNRVDDVLVFRPLAKADLDGVLRIQLAKLAKLLAARGVSLDVSPDARARLVALGYEPAFGARPLRRAILRHLADPLAEALLSSATPEGAVATVDVAPDADDRFAVAVAAPKNSKSFG